MVRCQDDSAGHRLAVHQLQLVRRFFQRLRGRLHGGRAEHTAGHGVRHARQRRSHRRPVHGHTACDRVQPVGHVQARVHGIVLGGVFDGWKGGQHVRRYQPRRATAADHRGNVYGHGVTVVRSVRGRRSRIHADRGGHGRHADGRPHTDTHVRVPVGHRVHNTVRDAGQRFHGRRGHTRGYVPDERAAGRQDRQSQRHVSDRAHLLRHRQPHQRRQLRHHSRVLHYCRTLVVL